jgi:DNA polymerase (family 10)
MAAFTQHEDVAKVLATGSTKSTVRLRSGLQVDVRVVQAESFGAALHYFTGSKSHNIALRRRAQQRGLKLNEYGLWKGDQRIAGRNEAQVFRALGLSGVPPELREDRGEVEAAAKGRLPRLVERDDLRGDLHVHTDASDGKDPLSGMVEAARALGHAYLAVTDHSPHPVIAQGLKPDRLHRRAREVSRLNDRLDDFTVLLGAEVDIDRDGRLDYPKEVLRDLDVVVCSVHSSFLLGRKAQTRRVLAAMANEHAHILGHPTGRLIGRRAGIDVDLEALIQGAKDHGWAFEVDGQPLRLDLDDASARRAVEAGVRLSLSSDAHTRDELRFIDGAVHQARRGWVKKEDVLNAMPLGRLRKALRR